MPDVPVDIPGRDAAFDAPPDVAPDAPADVPVDMQSPEAEVGPDAPPPSCPAITPPATGCTPQMPAMSDVCFSLAMGATNPTAGCVAVVGSAALNYVQSGMDNPTSVLEAWPTQVSGCATTVQARMLEMPSSMMMMMPGARPMLMPNGETFTLSGRSRAEHAALRVDNAGEVSRDLALSPDGGRLGPGARRRRQPEVRRDAGFCRRAPRVLYAPVLDPRCRPAVVYQRAVEPDPARRDAEELRRRVRAG